MEGSSLQPRSPEEKVSGLRGYGQRDPLIEYKKESFSLFQAMKERVDEGLFVICGELRGRSSATRRCCRRPVSDAAPAPLILNDPSAESSSSSVLTATRPPQEANPFGPPRQRVHRISSRRVSAATTRSRDRASRRAESRTQRPLPLRQRKSSEMPRSRRLTNAWKKRATGSDLFDTEREGCDLFDTEREGSETQNGRAKA